MGGYLPLLERLTATRCPRAWVRCFGRPEMQNTGSATSPRTQMHLNCRDKGPTLVVIRSGQRIFGGFNPVTWRPWKQNGWHIPVTGAWVFRVDNAGATVSSVSLVSENMKMVRYCGSEGGG